MKKSFLILAATVMLGLAACGEKPEPTPPAPVTPDVPTEAGKVTFYFEMGADSVAIPDYAGIFLTGAFFGKEAWPTNADEVVQLKKLENSDNIYWGQWEGDIAAVEDKGYQLTLGYTKESGAPSTGVNWSFKSMECQAGSGDSGMDNLNFEVSADGLTANLGTHHWEEVPGPVVVVEDITLKITLKEAVPAWVTLYAPGNFNNPWACDPAKDAMTPSEDRKTWSIDVPEIAVGSYEMKVIAEYTGGAWGWKNVVLDNGEGGNYSLLVLRSDNHGSILLDGGEPIEFDFSGLPNPETIPDVEVTFKVSFAAELDTAKYPDWFVIGSHNGWKAEDDKKFVVAADKKSMTLTFTVGHMLSYEFGICANSSWNPCFKLAGEGDAKSNFSLPVPDKATTYLFSVNAEIMAKLNADGGEFGIPAPQGAAE